MPAPPNNELLLAFFARRRGKKRTGSSSNSKSKSKMSRYREEDPLDAVLRPPPDETPEQAVVREAREAEARRVSAAIDADIKAERLARRKKRIVRLLLLGQSESGKSTTLRRPSSLSSLSSP